MRNIYRIVLLTPVLLFTSCAQKDAREYAKKLAGLLSDYSIQIDAKLADEQKRYVNEAKRNETALEDDEAQRLEDLRSSKSSEAAKNLKAKSLPPSTFLSTLIPTYAKTDFDSSLALYEKSQTAYMAHLKGLVDLSIEKAKIEALRQAILALAKDPGVFAEARNIGKFGSDLKDKVNLNTCSSAASELTAANKRVTDLTAAIADSTKVADKTINTAKLTIAQADAKAARDLAVSTGKFSNQSTCQ